MVDKIILSGFENGTMISFNNTARKLAHNGCICILQCIFESCCVQTGMRLVSEHNHIYCQCRFCYQWEGVKK